MAKAKTRSRSGGSRPQPQTQTKRSQAASEAADSGQSGLKSGLAWPLAAAAVALAVVGLGIFQWLELIWAQTGPAPFCSIDETINCERVWNSAFAKAIHRGTGVPLAGWGIVWGLAALVTSAGAAWRATQNERGPGLRWGARLTALAGVASCGVFVAASGYIGAICLTCVATYVLVLAFGLLTLKLDPGQPFSQAPLGALFGVPLAAVLIGYLAVLGPGLKTSTVGSDRAAVQAALGKNARSEPAVERNEPKAGTGLTPKGPVEPRPEPERPDVTVDQFMSRLPGPAREGVKEALQRYRNSPQQRTEKPRHLVGSPDAPVRIVDFVDVMCGHCAHLHDTIEQLHQMFPSDMFAVETRFFPLDRACNPEVPRGSASEATSVRCVGAKGLICAEGDPGYARFKSDVFDHQQSLSVQKVKDLARVNLTDMNPVEFERCLADAATDVALKADIAYAERFEIMGTPLMVINGREVMPPALPFIAALIHAAGDPNHPGFE